MSHSGPILSGPDGPASPSRLPGPYPVGVYAARLRSRLREFTRVQLSGEVFGVSRSRVRVYFELRDANGALPCSMWRDEFDALGLTLTDGLEVIVGGGCDYYAGNATSSPSFHFAVTELRIAGEGDLLADAQALMRATTPSLRFGAVGPGGEPASTCTLFLDEDVGGRRVATVEAVATLRDHREQGLARAAVCAAMRAAGAWHADLIVVPADADDWPQLLYASLGFGAARPPLAVRALRRLPTGGGVASPT